MLMRLKSKKGFTLIELIVVIAIIAILAAILIPRFTGFSEKAKENSTKADARNIAVAVEALLAEGDTNITATEVEKYMGKSYGTKLVIETDGDFTYTSNGYKATFTATSGEIDVVPTVSPSPSPTT